MGVPRSNSPSTVSHRVVEDVKKDLREVLREMNRETCKHKQQDEQQLQDRRPRSVDEIDDFTSTRYLKNELKALLSANNGCATDKEVSDIIAKLSERNPSPKDFAKLDFFPGDYDTLTVPTFPGRIKAAAISDEDIVQYTLGRLSFNIFQPNELVCTVRSIQNQIHPQHKENEKKEKETTLFSYHFMIDLTIHTPDGNLEATLINKGFCLENENRNNRMSVTFTGGTLIPGYETSNTNRLLDLWERTFANAYERAREERTLIGWIYHYCLVFFLGLTLPTDSKKMVSSQHENSFHFDIKRPPKGYFDVLYLDEDMRITKGNRGTITVLERVSSNGFSQ